MLKKIENSEQLQKINNLNQVIFNFKKNSDSFIKEKLREIKSDKKFYLLIKQILANKVDDQLLIDNLFNILLFKYDLDYCHKCPGFEKCDKKIFNFYNPHYNWILKKKNNYLSCDLSPCKLKIEDLKLDEPYKFNKFIYLGPFRDFPASWRLTKISHLDKSKSRLLLIKEYKKIVDDQKKWLFILGSNRSGKSLVAATLLNNLIALKHQKAIFINCVNRIRYLQEIYFSNKDEFNDLIQLYSNVKILVLDDFGKEYKNEFVRDNIVFPILNNRIRNNLITIFTSNFNYDELARIYAINIYGKVHGERLKQMLIDFAGDEMDISTVPIY